MLTEAWAGRSPVIAWAICGGYMCGVTENRPGELKFEFSERSAICRVTRTISRARASKSRDRPPCPKEAYVYVYRSHIKHRQVVYVW